MSDDSNDNDERDNEGLLPTAKLFEALEAAAHDAMEDQQAQMQAYSIIKKVDEGDTALELRVKRCMERIEKAIFEWEGEEAPPQNTQQELWFTLLVVGLIMDRIGVTMRASKGHPIRRTLLVMYHIALMGNDKDDEIRPEDIPTAGNA